MKLSTSILPLTIALSLVGGAALAEVETIDYTLGWNGNNDSTNADTDAAADSLYRLNSISTTPFVDSSLHNDIQLLIPQSGITYFTRFRLSTATLGFGQSASESPSNQQSSLVSSLYQIGYGTKVDSWFGGVNLSVEHFDDDFQREEGDLWSMGIYAGGRLGLTGLDADAPFWVLGLTGEYDQYSLSDKTPKNDLLGRTKWFVTPGVRWVADSFSLTAGVQLPLDARYSFSSDEPDYRIRADFSHRF